ncbi:efflux RND transporter periplasmic adaptor subunit, partial [Methylogaea oryzae]
ASARVVVPPGREFMVSATHAGLVSRIDVAVGDTVTKGQVLAQMASPAFLTLQREALQASHEHHLADSLLNRDQKLLAEGAIPKRRWDETRTLHDKNSAGDAEVRQVLSIAGMTPAEIDQLFKTQKLTDRLEIRAPVSGTVLERLVTTGERVDQLAALFRVADVSRLWLEIDLPPEQVDKVADGDVARVQGREISARIDSVGKQV